MKTKAIIIFTTAFLLSTSGQKSTHAGAVEGPYVIWINLSKNKSIDIDNKVKKYLNSGDDLCWNVSARMYMRTRPAEITEPLVRDGLINGSRQAQTKIRSILRKPYGEATGFDGVIAYTDTPQPQFISISLKGKIRQDFITDIADLDAVKISLCLVMPPISRKP